MPNLEEQLIDQIRTRMRHQKRTQKDLGQQISPDSKNPGQVINQYLQGQKPLVTHTLLKVLQALGARRITIHWDEDPQT
ncbi:hypothetical protein [Deinococcus roseus]|uniref:HTH cro/C1-type domain-containing protein n=1 Tax=Deinococcus roseus TaxID=392414 RepID=A0ABQ2D8T1_9DEIO|nr:hypothetical protein [Deinococcus roseus]GGJ47872.1 hypothetical protein GCM10008938_37340 [Deinococcus roseus]